MRDGFLNLVKPHHELPDFQDERTLETDLKELSEAARHLSREQRSNRTVTEILVMDMEAKAEFIATNER